MRLVDDWKQAWKWYSVQGPVLGLALVAAWGALPDEVRASFTPGQLQAAGVALLVLTIGGRLVAQK